MGLALAITLAVISVASNNIGKVLQKAATKSLPRLQADVDVLRQYLACRLWVTGAALDVLGGFIIVVALAMAPIAVLQPVAGKGQWR